MIHCVDYKMTNHVLTNKKTHFLACVSGNNYKWIATSSCNKVQTQVGVIFEMKQTEDVQTASVAPLRTVCSVSLFHPCVPPRPLRSLTPLISRRAFLVKRIPTCTCQVTHDHGRTRLPVMTFTAVSDSIQVCVSPLPEIVRQILS